MRDLFGDIRESDYDFDLRARLLSPMYRRLAQDGHELSRRSNADSRKRPEAASSDDQEFLRQTSNQMRVCRCK